MAPKRIKRNIWSKKDMDNAVDMYINSKTKGITIATKMNIPLPTLYLRVIKKLMQQKKLSILETQNEENKSINENSNQFPSTSNFISDNSVTDLNCIQEKQTHLTDTTCILVENIENQLPQKQNNQENITVNKKHKTFGNNRVHEKDLVVEECDLFGKYIVNQLRQFNDQTRALVKHKLQTVLFEAEMGQLTKCKEEPLD